MRVRIQFVAGIAGLMLFSAAGRAANPVESSDQSDSVAGHRAVLDDAVRVALQRELDGNDVDRNALLKHVLDQDPDHFAARWHLGYVNTGEEWVPYQRSLRTGTDRHDRLALYREYRETRGDTRADHLLLANAAREQELWDEERSHLMRLVELDRDHAEARGRLGDVKVDGFWVTREEINSFASRLMETRIDLENWGADIDRIVQRLSGSRRAAWELAWADLTSIQDPAAIPAVEQALAAGDDRAADWYLEWLRGLDAWEASVALARQAVYSPAANVRSKAQISLRDRRIDDYAPVLLGAMRADPVSSNRLYVTPFGGLLYVQTIAYETQNDVRQRNLAVLYGPERDVTYYRNRGYASRPLGALVESPELRARALQHIRRHYGGFTSASGGDQASNLQVMNERVARTLAAATGINQYESPQDWWDWWNGYQQVAVNDAKPRFEEDYEEVWSVERRRTRRTREREGNVRISPMSCFAAGVSVVTEYGPKPIESIVIGDRVLAQDVDSGRIAFKPVFQTTMRPPVALLKITTEDGELVCTGGHPFWINGLGWRYAWELEPGMRFHAVDGSREIISIEDSGRSEEAYNLVVADYHNYFVGEGRILSHDNSPRNPTNALVPGLMPDWSAQAEQP